MWNVRDRLFSVKSSIICFGKEMKANGKGDTGGGKARVEGNEESETFAAQGMQQPCNQKNN